MKKTEQHQLNKTIGECLENVRDALKIGSKSRELLMKLLRFEGNRIDAIENKIDLLMTERAVEIAKRAESATYEEKIPEQLEEIHFDGYHFEVAPWDESEEMEWNRAIKFGDHDDGWRLPTIDELKLMYLSRERLGMKDKVYWSSSEYVNDYAWFVYFNNGNTGDVDKNNSLRVRLVRTIEDE